MIGRIIWDQDDVRAVLTLGKANITDSKHAMMFHYSIQDYDGTKIGSLAKLRMIYLPFSHGMAG
jgi:hypothetical protein